MRYFIKNQPWSTKPDTAEFLSSPRALEWNLWTTRQAPFNVLSVGDRVILARPGTKRDLWLDWVVEVTGVLADDYSSLANNFDLMQGTFPKNMRAIGATRSNWRTRWEYNRSAPSAGHVLAFTMRPLLFLEIPRDPSLRIRPNGWLELSELQYREIVASTLSEADTGSLPGSADSTVEEDEGKAQLRVHMVRERNPKLVEAKKREALELNGRLKCEACGFDFQNAYGPLGNGFIECHHLRPLSVTGPTRTSLKDMALLCANCHRMIHRSSDFASIAGFRKLLQQQQRSLDTGTSDDT